MTSSVNNFVTLNCPCKKQIKVVVESVGCYNVGEVADRSKGWKFLALPDGGSVWLCPKCKEKAQKLAERLVELTGTVDFLMSAFVKRPKDL